MNKLKTLTKHTEFPNYNNGYCFNDWDEGTKRAWFVPDNVIYTAPDGHRYLIIPNPNGQLQGVLYTSDPQISVIGYRSSKQYIQVHSGRGFVVYAFLPAFNETHYKPAAWFDHVKNNPDELKR